MNYLRKFSSPRNWYVIILMTLSVLIRWVLIFKGGSYFFIDESRYLDSQSIATAIVQNNFAQALADATNGVAHLGFRILGAIPALGEILLHLPAETPAIFFSLFSVFNLYLIWKIAQRIGMSDSKANFALFLATASHSMIYFSRHLLPYDTALFFGLSALYVGLDNRQILKTSFIAGCLSFLCFITYNGYWALAGFATIFPVLQFVGKKEFLQKALFTLAGFAAPLIFLAILMSAYDVNIFSDYINFAQTVNQGSYTEGWKLPIEYLWNAEHTMFVFLVIFSLYTVLDISRDNLKQTAISLGGIVSIYLCLAVPSSIFHSFVVYGRLSRQLVPFLVLAATQGFFMLMNKTMANRYFAIAIVVLICIQAIINYRGSYEIIYPREFIKIAEGNYPPFKMSLKKTNLGAPAICKYQNFIVTNAKYIYPIPEALPDIDGIPLISVPHPINFLPYQYEGYTPEERQIIQDKQPKMELYQVHDEKNLAQLKKVKSCVAGKP